MLRLVLVDDEPAVIRRLSRIIDWRAHGWSVVATARDGEDGLAAVVEHKADLVIADIRMPVIDGLRMTEKVRALEHQPDVILLTGYEEFEYAREGLRLGVTEYLLKPVDAEKLVAAIDTVRSRRARSAVDQLSLDRKQWARRATTGSLEAGESIHRLGLSGRELFAVVVQHDELEPSVVEQAAPDDVTLIHTRTIEDGEEFVVALQGAARAASPGPAHAAPAEAIERVVERLPGNLRAELVVGVGSTANTPGKLVRSAGQALEASRQSFYLGRGRVIRAEAVGRSGRPPQESAEALHATISAAEARLRSTIRTMDVDGVSSALDELERLIREQTPAPGSARQALLELSVAVDHAFAGDLASRDSVIAAETANRLPTLRELVDAIREQATTLAGRIGAKWGLRTELLSDWLLRYMRGHYNEQLTLRSIADLVNLNPVYLGQRFRSETGKSFHDALLEVRMAVASQALASSDTPVHVIAEQVGYLAPVNFYKGFKKVYGVSPAKYRQRKATEENQL